MLLQTWVLKTHRQAQTTKHRSSLEERKLQILSNPPHSGTRDLVGEKQQQVNHPSNGWSEILKGWRKTLWSRTRKIFYYSTGLNTNYFCDLRQVVFLLGASIFSSLKGYSGKGRWMNSIESSFKFKFWNSQMTNLQNRLFAWRKHECMYLSFSVFSGLGAELWEPLQRCSLQFAGGVSWLRLFLLNKETTVELILFLHICGLVNSQWRCRCYTRLHRHSHHPVVQLITRTAVVSSPGLAVTATCGVVVQTGCGVEAREIKTYYARRTSGKKGIW